MTATDLTGVPVLPGRTVDPDATPADATTGDVDDLDQFVQATTQTLVAQRTSAR